MRQGVYDSDVFVLFLTNKVLSRTFCIKEIKWAIEFGKPILIVRETEERFWPFDIERWRNDHCARNAKGGWETGWLQNTFAACDPVIVDEIERQWSSSTMMPFRRREFEANALVREIIRRASDSCSVAWGQHLPPSRAIAEAQCEATRHVFAVNANNDRADEIMHDLHVTLSRIASETRFRFDDVDDTTTHVLVLLSSGLLDQGSASHASLERVETMKRRSSQLIVVYVYVDGDASDAWDFAALNLKAPTNVTKSIASNEALKYRSSRGGSASTVGSALVPIDYEHTALALELLKRMRVAKQGGERR